MNHGEAMLCFPAVSSEQNRGGISHDMSGLMAAVITSLLKWNMSQKSKYSLKDYKAVHSQLGSDILMTMKGAEYHCWFFIFPFLPCRSLSGLSQSEMHINLNGKQRSYDFLSIHSPQNTNSGEYNKERQYPSMLIVSIEGDQHMFYWQIKDYPFLLLVLEKNAQFSKTSRFFSP